MNKVISFILVAVLIIGLCACGDNKVDQEEKTLSKEEMLEQSIEIDIDTINSESQKNLANAKNQYCDKFIELTGKVAAINEDHIVMTPWFDDRFVVDAYLPTEELISLTKGIQMTVVGKMSSEIIIPQDGIDASKQTSHYQMPVAHFVTDHYETEGYIKIWTTKDGGVDWSFNTSQYGSYCDFGLSFREPLDINDFPTFENHIDYYGQKWYTGRVTIVSTYVKGKSKGYNEFFLYDNGDRYGDAVLIDWEK